MPNVAFPILIR